MKYLLDTNTCIRYLNGRAPALRTKLLSLSADLIAVSAITRAEMFYGAAKSRNPEGSRAQQQIFFARFTSLPFDDKAAHIYGDTRALLEQRSTPIGSYDLLIAAIALSNALCLVTHNVREFSRIPNLLIEDWEVS